MVKYKALLFDLDGTLVDSEHFHFNTWNELLAASGIELTYHDFLNNYAGIPLPGNAKRLKELYNTIDTSLEDLIAQKEFLTVERLKTTAIDLMPFVEDTLDYFHSQNLAMALVTASKRPDVEEMFRKNSLNKYFKFLVTRSDVKQSKPDPESYLLAVEKIGYGAEECLVFEDTLNGLRAAKAAGLTCFVIQANTDDHEKLKEADRIFLNLDEARQYLVANNLI